MTDAVKYEHTADEISMAKVWGRERRLHAIWANGKNKQVDTARGVQVEVEGVAGEIAFCRTHGLEPDYSLLLRCGEPDAVYRGNRVDVKATRYSLGHLLVYLPKRGDKNDYSKIDLFVLVRLHLYPNISDVVGFAAKAEVMRREHVRNLGHGPTYRLPNGLLHPIEEIRTWKTSTSVTT